MSKEIKTLNVWPMNYIIITRHTWHTTNYSLENPNIHIKVFLANLLRCINFVADIFELT